MTFPEHFQSEDQPTDQATISLEQQLSHPDFLGNLNQWVQSALDDLLAAAAQQPDQQQLFIETPLSPEQITTVVTARIKTLVEPLVAAIEAAQPGHSAGQAKVDHMEKLGQQLELEVAELNIYPPLTAEETKLLGVIGNVHDIGRHVEAFLRLNTLTAREKMGHGQLGLWLLLQPGLLDELTPRAKYQLLYATLQHAGLELPVPRSECEQRAYQLTYVLRDLDKQELLHKDIFSNPTAAVEQLIAHYLPPDLLTVDPVSLAVYVQRWLAVDGPVDSQVAPQLHPQLKARVDQVLTAPIDAQAWQYFTQEQPIPIGLIKNSWAAYALLQLAVIFDVKHQLYLERILDDARVTMGSRLKVIKKIDAHRYEQAIEVLVNFFGQALLNHPAAEVKTRLIEASS